MTTSEVAPPASRAGDRFAALDGVRILAATAVVLVHVGGSSGYTFTRSWGGWFEVMSVGVAVFFVISGFVVFQPWVRAAVTGAPAPDTARFLVRRFARVVPAYWVVVVACLVLLSSGATLVSWLRHLSLTQIYAFGALSRGLGQTWTLCVEILFYLVLPAFAAVVIRRRPGQPWRPARTVALIVVITSLVTLGWLAALVSGVLKLYLHHMWLPGYATWFGAGMVLCVASVALREGMAPRAWRLIEEIGARPWLCWGAALAWTAAGSTGVAGPRGIEPYTGREFTTRVVLHLLVAVMVVIPLVFGPPTRLRAVVGSPPMRWLGGSLSYGLYLWHPFAIAVVHRLTGWPEFGGHLFGILTLAMVLGLSLALVSYYLVERPVIRLAGRFKGRRRSTRTAAMPEAPAPAAVEV